MDPKEAQIANRRFVNKRQARAALGDPSERKFDDLRARGLLPDPFEFGGPRTLRWDLDELLAAAAKLPRARRSEPPQLAAGRAAKADQHGDATPAIQQPEQHDAPARAARAAASQTATRHTVKTELVEVAA